MDILGVKRSWAAVSKGLCRDDPEHEDAAHTFLLPLLPMASILHLTGGSASGPAWCSQPRCPGEGSGRVLWDPAAKPSSPIYRYGQGRVRSQCQTGTQPLASGRCSLDA